MTVASIKVAEWVEGDAVGAGKAGNGARSMAQSAWRLERGVVETAGLVAVKKNPLRGRRAGRLHRHPRRPNFPKIQGKIFVIANAGRSPQCWILLTDLIFAKDRGGPPQPGDNGLLQPGRISGESGWGRERFIGHLG